MRHKKKKEKKKISCTIACSTPGVKSPTNEYVIKFLGFKGIQPNEFDTKLKRVADIVLPKYGLDIDYVAASFDLDNALEDFTSSVQKYLGLHGYSICYAGVNLDMDVSKIKPHFAFSYGTARNLFEKFGMSMITPPTKEQLEQYLFAYFEQQVRNLPGLTDEEREMAPIDAFDSFWRRTSGRYHLVPYVDCDEALARLGMKQSVGMSLSDLDKEILKAMIDE